MHKLILVTLLCLVSCRSDETLTGQTDASDQWRLIKMNGQAVTQDIFMSFPETGRMTSSGPCNQITAEQRAPLPWFELGPIASTKRACPELEFEAKYIDMLATARLVEIQDDHLILSTENEELAVFKK